MNTVVYTKGLAAGEVIPVNSDDTSEAEVDCGTEESRADGQGDNAPIANGKDWFKKRSTPLFSATRAA
jgi:hypothetical protein